MPTGSVSLPSFSHGLEGPADTAVIADKNSPKVGKFTHPSAAPDNHMLTVRGFYFSHLFVAPNNEEKIYFLSLLRSNLRKPS